VVPAARAGAVGGGGPYTVAADVGDARRVLDALGWDMAYVVGHSWGGQLALHVTDGAERIPGAWVEVVEGAGHFVWVEAPGAVRAALRRLTAD
jgi:pimeloyl-ACP methyl ester carboxylesterase